MKIFFASITTLFILSGCAAPAAVQQQASTVLIGSCKELFLSSSFGGYQHVAAQIGGKAVFALAIDEASKTQACGVGRSNTDAGRMTFGLAGSGVSWEQLEAIAIARCETNKRFSAPCTVFAKNNEIVWKQGAKVDFR